MTSILPAKIRMCNVIVKKEGTGTRSHFNEQLNKTPRPRVRGPQGRERHPSAVIIGEGSIIFLLSPHSSKQFTISETQTKKHGTLRQEAGEAVRVRS